MSDRSETEPTQVIMNKKESEADQPFLSPKTVLIITTITFSLFFALIISKILFLNGGVLSYTLDDPYLHLALAENIVKGHYGINLNEFSAPSSSILWPFLLTPFMFFEAADYAPLIINFLASLGFLFVLKNILYRVFKELSENRKHLFILFTLMLAIVAMNLLGLAFIGMEHSLQLFLTILLIEGLIWESESGTMPSWLGVVILLGPLVRYENLALSLPALCYLFIRGHKKNVVLTAVLLFCSILGFSLFLNSHNLGFFPSSVMVKSSVVASGGAINQIQHNLHKNLSNRQGSMVALGLMFLIYVCFDKHKNTPNRLLALWATVAITAHLFIGRFGWFNRYEIYIWPVIIFPVLYIWGPSIVKIVEKFSLYKIFSIITLTAFFIFYPSFQSTLQTPIAANNIFEQQFQMRRFATEYLKAPVAVNDLGWVAYRNKKYVLDLWGLGSQTALEKRMSREPSEKWMKDLARKYDIKLAMIYRRWFNGNLPDNWFFVGTLHLGNKRKITPALDTVHFYAVGYQNQLVIDKLLPDFKKTLPEGVVFQENTGRYF